MRALMPEGTVTVRGDVDAPLDPDWEQDWLASWDEQTHDDGR